jgi:tetratricopeptide (TPR) repeat protein
MARHPFERAQTLGGPQADGIRLSYRLGKVWSQTGEPPERVIETLTQSLEAGAEGPIDLVRAYGFLADAYLHLVEPDLEKALAANEKQLQQPIVEDAILAQPRLLRGELLLRLNRAEEAREALKNVGAHAPPALVVQARLLRLQSLESEGLWPEAAALWREALDDRRAPVRERPAALYRLGVCAVNAEQRDEAIRAWSECVRLNAPGDETPAAALRLAELLVREQPASAVAAFERAVRDVNAPQEWQNPLLALERARAIFETACQLTRKSGAYEASIRMARLYERLAVPGRASHVRALAAEAWALGRQEEARQSPRVEEVRRLQAEAEGLFVQAGEGYEQAAQAVGQVGEKGELLWRGANRYLDGRDFKRAVATFDQFTRVVRPPGSAKGGPFEDRLGEAWFKRAEAHRALGDERMARAAYLECLNWPGRFAYRARYELALTMRTYNAREQRWDWSDDAQRELQHNLQLLREARDDRDDWAREKTLYALGNLYYERAGAKKALGAAVQEELSRAITCLEAALEQFPNSAEALTARYDLAESYTLLAEELAKPLGPHERSTLETRLRIAQEVAQNWERAVANYERLGAVLVARPQRDATEARLLAASLFQTARCRYMLGDYDKAGELYESLVQRYKGHIEEYTALAGMVRAYGVPGGRFPDKAKYALEQIRRGLDRMPEDVRKEFVEWLKAFDQPLETGRR